MNVISQIYPSLTVNTDFWGSDLYPYSQPTLAHHIESTTLGVIGDSFIRARMDFIHTDRIFYTFLCGLSSL